MALNSKGSGFGLDLEERLKRTQTPAQPQTQTYTHTQAQTQKEYKTKRLYMITKPSTFEKLDAYAKERGDSVNNVVNTLIEEFIEREGL